VKFDVVIIGAGAAGLAAARDLSGAGKRICIIEARPRVGGRVFTRHVSDLPLPIELGAEFIHGDAPETFSIVDAAALIACELPDDHWWLTNGKWQRIPDFWGDMARLQKQISRIRRDISFADFLRTRRNLPPRKRQLARNFVEGYHASHADRISAMALAAGDEEQERPKQYRILGGYDSLIEWLRAGLDPERAELRLGTRANIVNWRAGEVEVECESLTVRADAAIITIPIGVWKAPSAQEGAIRFEPPLEEKRKILAKLEVGHVVKIMFRFAERFWEDPESPRNFIHSADRFIPTWWSSAPIRSHILTAWSGGHAADALLAEGPDARIGRALDSLSATLRMPRRRIDQLLLGSWTHDWQSDPFSRGAYSYAGVGGSAAHKALAKPLKRTLFFAGEATNQEQTGTVAGAVESGRRAAREIVSRALRRSG
jgi:monoamine oxidase